MANPCSFRTACMVLLTGVSGVASGCDRGREEAQRASVRSDGQSSAAPPPVGASRSPDYALVGAAPPDYFLSVGRVFGQRRGVDSVSLVSEAGVVRWSLTLDTAPLLAAIDSTQIIVGDDEGRVMAISRNSGRLRWCVRVFRGRTPGRPVVSEGRIFVATSGMANEGLPGIVETDVRQSAEVVALDAVSGRTIWRRRVVGRDAFLVAGTRPNALVIGTAGSRNGRPEGRLLRVKGSDGEQVWQLNSGPVRPGMTLENEMIFVGAESTLKAVQLEDGKVRWTARDRISQAFPAKSGNLVVTGGSDSTVEARRASDGALVWRTSVPIGRASPAVVTAGQQAFVSSGEGVTVLETSRGRLLRTVRGPDAIGRPLIVGRSVVASTVNSTPIVGRASNG